MKPTTVRAMRFLAAPICAAVAAGIHFRLNVPWDRFDAATETTPVASEPVKAEPRSAEELERLERRYGALPIEEEPVLPGWARGAQSKARKAFVLARQQAFAGAPDRPQVIVTEVACHTLRCQLVLRSEYAHELWQVVEAMRTLAVGDAPLWRDFSAAAREENTPGDEVDAEDSHAQLEVLVQFRDDQVEVDDAEPDPEAGAGGSAG